MINQNTIMCNYFCGVYTFLSILIEFLLSLIILQTIKYKYAIYINSDPYSYELWHSRNQFVFYTRNFVYKWIRQSMTNFKLKLIYGNITCQWTHTNSNPPAHSAFDINQAIQTHPFRAGTWQFGTGIAIWVPTRKNINYTDSNSTCLEISVYTIVDDR